MRAADCLHLLAQQHFALPLAQLLLDLGLDVFLRVEHRDLALDVDYHPTQPVLHGQRLQQLLALDRLDIEVPGNEIGEGAGVTHALQDLLHDLGGQARLLSQLGGALADLAVQRYERSILLIERRKIGRFANRGFEIAVGLRIVDRGTAAFAMQDQLDTAKIALDLTDARDRAGGIEHGGRYLIDVLLLGDREDLAVGLLEGGFYGT